MNKNVFYGPKYTVLYNKYFAGFAIFISAIIKSRFYAKHADIINAFIFGGSLFVLIKTSICHHPKLTTIFLTNTTKTMNFDAHNVDEVTFDVTFRIVRISLP